MDWDPPETWERQADFLRNLAANIGKTPEAILIVSAHWEESHVTIQNNISPNLFFDYYGFPEHTYKLEYNPSGDLNLSAKVVSLLGQAGIRSKLDNSRGYDHGVFIPLKVAFPVADIPVVQLSLRADLDPLFHIQVGEALQGLRDEGVLIIGSGNTYHNMSIMMRTIHEGNNGIIHGKEFDQWLTNSVTHVDSMVRNNMLIKWSEAPGGRESHPREEHLIPLHVVSGAAGLDRGRKIIEDIVLGAIQSGFQFG
jgi:aromatic ring-opening dioxygenase catalytic subunit (LigB family)